MLFRHSRPGGVVALPGEEREPDGSTGRGRAGDGEGERGGGGRGGQSSSERSAGP